MARYVAHHRVPFKTFFACRCVFILESDMPMCDIPLVSPPPGTRWERQMTVEEIRAQVEAAEITAMQNFRRDWGTDDVSVVMDALRQTIPASTSPDDATRKARARLA